MKKKIFIAGPIRPTGRGSDPVGEFLDNTRFGIRVAAELILLGFAPYCPFVDFMYWFASSQDLPTGTMMQECDLAWLENVDAVLALPGWETSVGATNELERAEELGIPVFYSVNSLRVRFFGE